MVEQFEGLLDSADIWREQWHELEHIYQDITEEKRRLQDDNDARIILNRISGSYSTSKDRINEQKQIIEQEQIYEQNKAEEQRRETEKKNAERKSAEDRKRAEKEITEQKKINKQVNSIQRMTDGLLHGWPN